MKILLTGSEGMLGQYFQKSIKNKNKLFLTSKRKNINKKNSISINFLNFTNKKQ